MSSLFAVLCDVLDDRDPPMQRRRTDFTSQHRLHEISRNEESVAVAASLQHSGSALAEVVFHIFDTQFESLDGLNLRNDVVESLRSMGITRPTAVQAKAWPVLLRGDDAVVTAETGSGKSLAYLVPILQEILSVGPTALHNPSAAVMVPTQELVMQLLNVVQTLSPSLSKVTRPAFLNFGPRPHEPFALLIGTPRAMRENVPHKRLEDLRTLVLDEADMLLTGQYLPDTREGLLTQFKMSAIRPQMVFCAATIPQRGTRSVQSFLDKFYADAVQVRTKGTHRANPQLFRTFVSVPLDESPFDQAAAEREARKIRQKTHPLEPEPSLTEVHMQYEQLQLRKEQKVQQEKEWILLQSLLCSSAESMAGTVPWQPVMDDIRNEADVLGLDEDAVQASLEQANGSVQFVKRDWGVQKPTKQLSKQVAANIPPTMVFVRSGDDVERVVRFLASRASTASVVGLHKKMRDSQRARAIAKFTSGEAQVLVTTDVGSRGLDLPLVEHVIQLDFAPDAVTHLHRIGRTGRMGRAGRVTNILGPDDASLARAVWLAEMTDSSVENAFGRRRGFRKRVRKAMSRQLGHQEADSE